MCSIADPLVLLCEGRTKRRVLSSYAVVSMTSEGGGKESKMRSNNQKEQSEKICCKQ